MSENEAEHLVCQWCGYPVPARTVIWWDEKPQCSDLVACMGRMFAPQKEGQGES